MALFITLVLDDFFFFFYLTLKGREKTAARQAE